MCFFFSSHFCLIKRLFTLVDTTTFKKSPVKEENFYKDYINWRKSGGESNNIERLKCLHFFFRREERLKIESEFKSLFTIEEDNQQLAEVDNMDLNLITSEYDLPLFERSEEEPEPLFKKEVISEQDNIENNLIIGLAACDSWAFEELYDAEYHKIQDYVTNNSGSRTETQDVFQDGVVVLLEKIKTPGFEFACRVGTYLYSCCKNIWLKQIRKSNRTVKNDYFEYYPTTEVEFDLEPVNLDNKIKVILETLSESCLKLFKAFYYESKSWDAIAKELGYNSTNSAKNQKYKCLKKIEIT